MNELGLFDDNAADDDVADLTASQRQALRKIERGGFYFLTGAAGTGKSYLVKRLIERAGQNKKNIVITASTGVAALNIGGDTAYSVFSFQNYVSSKANAELKDLIHKCIKIKRFSQCENLNVDINEALLSADLVIVDEISMIRIDHCQWLLAQIMKCFRKNKNKNKACVLVGDFYQLPPVIGYNDECVVNENAESADEKYLQNEEALVRYGGWHEYAQAIKDGAYAFAAPNWKKAAVETIELIEPIRQTDAGFVQALNQIRHGKLDSIEWFNTHCAMGFDEKAIVVTPRKKGVRKYNERKLAGLGGVEYQQKAIITGELKQKIERMVAAGNIDDLPIIGEYIFRFKIGCRVVAQVNDSENEFRNGSTGTVMGYHQDGVLSWIEVDFDDVGVQRVYLRETEKYSYRKGQRKLVGTIEQYPLKLGYAVSIHKSQGQTYTTMNLDLSQGLFANGQLYVALSRCRTIGGLHLKKRIVADDVICSKAVQEFYSA